MSVKPEREWRRAAFTLIEVMVALVLLATTLLIAFSTFWAVSRAWKRGTEISSEINHGDFVIEQLAMGLRSTYFPDSARKSSMCGFWLRNSGSGAHAKDAISWMKLGNSLSAGESRFADGPHRVEFLIIDSADYDNAAAARVWRPYQQPEEFDYETDVEPILLSGKIEGFNCRVATNKSDGEIEWEDEWEATNTLPAAVEITLYLEPKEEGEESLVMKRYIKIPVAEKLWKWR